MRSRPSGIPSWTLAGFRLAERSLALAFGFQHRSLLLALGAQDRRLADAFGLEHLAHRARTVHSQFGVVCIASRRVVEA